MAATILPMKMFLHEDDEGVGRRGRGGKEEEGVHLHRGCCEAAAAPSLQDLCLCQNVRITLGSSALILPTGEALPMLFVMNEGEARVSPGTFIFQESVLPPPHNLLSPEPVLYGDESYEVCAQKQLKLCLQKDEAENGSLKMPPSF